MAISFLAPARTVLLISDEALYIYATGANGARVSEIVPWNAENFEENVASIITKDCNRKPILILNDMVEQHYRKERVVRAGVGVLDKSGMVKRKLNVTFPSYPVKAAFPLKEKLPKTDGKQAADIYIFAAVPGSDQFSKTIGAAKKSLASIAGLCLLPVESSDMVQALANKLAKGKKSQSKWVVFMGQHKSGGLRQIVTKNGELALTRMTPITDIDTDSAAWTRDVHQEFGATMSYLSRFGYQPEDGLDVIVVGDPIACEPLETMIEVDCNFSTMSVEEAARTLGMPFARGGDDRYAEALHVGWAGRKGKFILPMQASQLEEISKPRQMAMLGSLILLLSAGFFGYQAFNEFQGIAETNDQIDTSKRRFSQLDVQYQKEVQRKEDLGFDVRLVQSSIAVKGRLDKELVKPLELMAGLAKSLGKDLRIDNINIEQSRQLGLPLLDVNQFGGGAPKPKTLFVASMQMTYPSTTDVDKGNQEVRDLSARLRQVLPDYKVEVTKFLKDYEYVEEIVVESGDLDRKDVQQDFVAEIKVTGLVKQDD